MLRTCMVVAVAAVVGSCSQPEPRKHPAGATPYTEAEKAEIDRRASEMTTRPCDMKWSETEIAARKATGLVTDMDITARGLVITVDAARLARRPTGALESLVESADWTVQ